MRSPTLAIVFAATCAFWFGVTATVAGAAGWTFASVKSTGVLVAGTSPTPDGAARASALAEMPVGEAWRYVGGNVARPMFRAVSWGSVAVITLLGAMLAIGSRATLGGRAARRAWWVFMATAALFALQAWTDLSSEHLYRAVWDGWIADRAFDDAARAAAEAAHGRATVVYSLSACAMALLGIDGTRALLSR
ncbi:MAG: hypothetical protein FGM37_00490 [Phycisphaerales bacterium]|nr:hypothetical protein [Phycisphaerales bacterium]